jgi:hypothetical protein
MALEACQCLTLAWWGCQLAPSNYLGVDLRVPILPPVCKHYKSLTQIGHKSGKQTRWWGGVATLPDLPPSPATLPCLESVCLLVASEN